MKRPSRASREAAEILAVQALGFIAEEPQSLSRFLDTSGIAADGIRAAAAEPGFLAGVLAYMLTDENLLPGLSHPARVRPGQGGRAARARISRRRAGVYADRRESPAGLCRPRRHRSGRGGARRKRARWGVGARCTVASLPKILP